MAVGGWDCNPVNKRLVDSESLDWSVDNSRRLHQLKSNFYTYQTPAEHSQGRHCKLLEARRGQRYSVEVATLFSLQPPSNRGVRGKRTVKVVSSPCDESTRMTPLWACTISRVI
jgi:hypothetical protein